MLQRIKNLLKANSLILAILVSIVIMVLSLIKIGKQPINFNSLDKVEHGIAYAILSFFWLLSSNKTKTNKLLIIFLCIFYGVLIEVLQGTTSYRTFDYVDMLANTIGVLIGFLIHNFFIKENNLVN